MRKRTVPAKRKSAEHLVPSHEAALEGRTSHWTQRVEPNTAVLLAENLQHFSFFVLKNHGPNDVTVTAGYRQMIHLSAGAVRALEFYGDLGVENKGDKPVLIAFDFLAVSKK
jgi:hypothetical protein